MAENESIRISLGAPRELGACTKCGSNPTWTNDGPKYDEKALVIEVFVPPLGNGTWSSLRLCKTCCEELVQVITATLDSM